MRKRADAKAVGKDGRCFPQNDINAYSPYANSSLKDSPTCRQLLQTLKAAASGTSALELGVSSRDLSSILNKPLRQMRSITHSSMAAVVEHLMMGPSLTKAARQHSAQVIQAVETYEAWLDRVPVILSMKEDERDNLELSEANCIPVKISNRLLELGISTVLQVRVAGRIGLRCHGLNAMEVDDVARSLFRIGVILPTGRSCNIEPQKYMSNSILESDALTLSTTSCLQAVGVSTFEDLECLPEDELLLILGPNRLLQIKEVMRSRDPKFPGVMQARSCLTLEEVLSNLEQNNPREVVEILKANGIVTVRDWLELGTVGALRLPNLGRKTVQFVEVRVEQFLADQSANL
ncbi:hypothetical protein [Noviherbaspirillum galbum]|uniref:Uncharacterized protein n=1 Tax=Noviherbaspirillum galbum TaxID=2709383 RepID=A0A6B3SLI3_9BURK|nr:hypothetical protein [Noviherbaspirillum galbum]NEX60235.1 hypothetical protein [Noviherbaspirillum galbum]